MVGHHSYGHWYRDGEEDVGHGNGEEGSCCECECCAGEIVGTVEEVGPSECGGDRECEEGDVGKGCGFGCALADDGGSYSKDDEVVGPDDSEDKSRWLP